MLSVVRYLGSLYRAVQIVCSLLTVWGQKTGWSFEAANQQIINVFVVDLYSDGASCEEPGAGNLRRDSFPEPSPEASRSGDRRGARSCGRDRRNCCRFRAARAE